MTNTNVEIARLRAELERQAVDLQECRHLLDESQVIAGLGTYVFDIPKGTWTSSAVLDGIFGIDDKYVRSVEGWASLIHPDWRDIMVKYFAEDVIAKGLRFDKEYKIVRRTGHEERWVHGLGRLEHDENGKPLRMFGTITDITERKQSEVALRASESQFRELWGATVEGIVILDQGIIVEVNDAMCRMFGYTREQSVGKSLLHFAPPDVHDSVRRRVTSELEGRFETSGLRADGERMVLEAFANQILYQGKHMRMVAVRDITERRRADEKLQNSEAFLNRLIEQSPVPMWIADDHGTLLRLNQACCELLNLKAVEVVGRYNILQDNIVKEQGFMPLVKTVFDRGDSVRFEINYDSAKVDGLALERTAAVHLEVTIFPIRDTHGRITNAVIQHNNITARKRAEEALQASERSLSTIYDTVGDVIFQLAVEPDRQYRFVSVNRAFCKSTGLSEEMVVAKLVNEVIPEPSLSRVLGNYEKAIEEKTVVRWEETSDYLTGRITGDVSVAPVIDSDGCCTHLVGSVHDVTERKRAEEAVRESEEKLKSYIEGAGEAIYVIEAGTGRIRNCNARACRDLGYTREEILEMSTKDIEARLTTGEVTTIHRDVESGGVKTIDGVHKRKDGSEFPVEIRLSSLASTQPELILAMARDVTERKRAEEALSTSEVRYRRLFEAARDGILILDADSGTVVDVNPFLVDLLGYQRDQILGKKIWELGFFKDTAANKVHLSELLRNEFIQYEDMPLETVKGLLINVEFVSHVYQVERHKVIQCNIRDITERKHAEEKLLVRLEELRRWQEATLGREDRIRELKCEVNALLDRLKEGVRYPSQESGAGNGAPSEVL